MGRTRKSRTTWHAFEDVRASPATPASNSPEIRVSVLSETAGPKRPAQETSPWRLHFSEAPVRASLARVVAPRCETFPSTARLTIPLRGQSAWPSPPRDTEPRVEEDIILSFNEPDSQASSQQIARHDAVVKPQVSATLEKKKSIRFGTECDKDNVRRSLQLQNESPPIQQRHRKQRQRQRDNAIPVRNGIPMVDAILSQDDDDDDPSDDLDVSVPNKTRDERQRKRSKVGLIEKRKGASSDVLDAISSQEDDKPAETPRSRASVETKRPRSVSQRQPVLSIVDNRSEANAKRPHTNHLEGTPAVTFAEREETPTADLIESISKARIKEKEKVLVPDTPSQFYLQPKGASEAHSIFPKLSSPAVIAGGGVARNLLQDMQMTDDTSAIVECTNPADVVACTPDLCGAEQDEHLTANSRRPLFESVPESEIINGPVMISDSDPTPQSVPPSPLSLKESERKGESSQPTSARNSSSHSRQQGCNSSEHMSESCDLSPCIVDGVEVNRMRREIGLSPASMEADQSLALDPKLASYALELLQRGSGTAKPSVFENSTPNRIASNCINREERSESVGSLDVTNTPVIANNGQPSNRIQKAGTAKVIQETSLRGSEHVGKAIATGVLNGAKHHSTTSRPHSHPGRESLNVTPAKLVPFCGNTNEKDINGKSDKGSNSVQGKSNSAAKTRNLDSERENLTTPVLISRSAELGSSGKRNENDLECQRSAPRPKISDTERRERNQEYCNSLCETPIALAGSHCLTPNVQKKKESGNQQQTGNKTHGDRHSFVVSSTNSGDENAVPGSLGNHAQDGTEMISLNGTSRRVDAVPLNRSLFTVTTSAEKQAGDSNSMKSLSVGKSLVPVSPLPEDLRPRGTSLLTNGKGVPLPPPSRARSDFVDKRLASATGCPTTSLLGKRPSEALSLHGNKEPRMSIVSNDSLSKPFPDGRGNSARAVSPNPLSEKGFRDLAGATTNSLFTTGHEDPGSVSDTVKKSLFTTGKGKHVPVPDTVTKSLFTTGKGVPVHVPDLATKSLFSTAKGNQVALPASASKPVFSAGKGSIAQLKDAKASSLFTTGRGQVVPLPPGPQGLPVGPGQGNLNPALNNSKSLFTNGRGNSVPIPDNSVRVAKALLFDQRPTTIDPPDFAPPRRRSAYSDLTSPASTDKRLSFRTPPAKTTGFPTTANNAANVTLKKGSTKKRTAMGTTPFKRPRRVPPVTPLRKTSVSAATGSGVPVLTAFFPAGAVPRLSTHGHLIQDNSGQQKDTDPTSESNLNSNRSKLSSSKAPFLLPDIESPRSALALVLSKDRFGDCSLLPKEVNEFLGVPKRDNFDVDAYSSLVSHVFPGIDKCAATRVGSKAWACMSYCLSVWKLARLEQYLEKPFLTVANLIRDLWRRIDREWHKNHAPHLVQMLRRDASPRAHVVLVVTDIQQNGTDKMILEVSDGWYICRMRTCDIIENFARSKLLKVGDKLHISESSLVQISKPEPFFFGNGDELGSVMLSPIANCVKRVPRSIALSCALGIRKEPLFIRSLSRLQQSGGLCPGAQVFVLRSYPVFYIESFSNNGDDEDSEKQCIFRRQEAEDRAQALFEDKVREALTLKAANGEVSTGENSEVRAMFKERCVYPAVEFLVCGVDDDPSTGSCRTIRVYRPNEDTKAIVAKEGTGIQLPALRPTSKLWVATSSRIYPLPLPKTHCVHLKPRITPTAEDLHSNLLAEGEEFDGVFAVIHLADISSEENARRFAYLQLGDPSLPLVVALELKGPDASSVPRALQRAKGKSQFPIVVLRDATLVHFDKDRDFIHAVVTLHTEILTSAALKRRTGASWNVLQNRVDEMATLLEGKTTNMEILREALTSFTSGRRQSIRAYFTGTQDSQN